MNQMNVYLKCGIFAAKWEDTLFQLGFIKFYYFKVLVYRIYS